MNGQFGTSPSFIKVLRTIQILNDLNNAILDRYLEVPATFIDLSTVMNRDYFGPPKSVDKVNWQKEGF